MLVVITATALAQTDAGSDGTSEAHSANQQPDDSFEPNASTEIPTPIAAADQPAPVLEEADVSQVLTALGGQDLSTLDLEALLENVVVAATKSEVKEDEAPAIITVVSRDEIQRWGYRSVDEVLRHVAGVYVVDDHIIPNVGIRGISGGL